ncbi:606_t:CDS:10 [Paraglomus brasilianum]|uniref:DNA mismatch repair protein MSH3 n=1 Tax=Paraglomus brasilianum TaxID=144538 RepID=A0A9N9DK37_9GLOM|nr:606_t:CDS:10 [Paraglomus brasilianum]
MKSTGRQQQSKKHNAISPKQQTLLNFVRKVSADKNGKRTRVEADKTSSRVPTNEDTYSETKKKIRIENKGVRSHLKSSYFEGDKPQVSDWAEKYCFSNGEKEPKNKQSDNDIVVISSDCSDIQDDINIEHEIKPSDAMNIEASVNMDENKNKRQMLHERFVKKLGNHAQSAMEIDERVPQETGRTPSDRAPSKSSSITYTPLEKQYLAIKRDHPDTLLIVEVGYKFKFFDKDAIVASKILSIAHFMDHNFYVASIPVHRLNVHVRRLVYAGYKVGVVRQMETAALKAAGDNRNTPFVRKLANLYTRGTFIEDILFTFDRDIILSDHVMAVVEEHCGGSGLDELVKISVLAVQIATGDIIYDYFDDGHMRNELETRLLHIRPCEILLPKIISKQTEKVISHITSRSAGGIGEKIRIERMDDIHLSYAQAFSFVSEFYSNAKNDINKGVAGESGESVVKARNQLLLNGNTISNLEIYNNQTDLREKGSLLWVLDHTRTPFGKRLLRKWIGRPLIDIGQLNERIGAVEEILHGTSPVLSTTQELLGKLPDLEKGLCKIHYAKCTPSELFRILSSLQRVSSAYLPFSSLDLNSPLLTSIFTFLPKIKPCIDSFLSVINVGAAERQDKFNLFKNAEKYREIQQHKENISAVEKDLNTHMMEIRQLLQKPKFEYKAVAGIEYLIEVKKAEENIVPKTWVKVCGTKAVSRFHSPTIMQKIKERDQHRERLSSACDQAYKNFLQEISDHYELLRDAIQKIAVLDCLFSLAIVSRQPGYVKPEFIDEAEIEVVNGRHPMIEQLNNTFVANDVKLSTNGLRTMILTGPNMGGKSSYIRQVALIAIMGQIGSYVPASSARLGILDAVYTRMGASDNMLAGESTFMVELNEASQIMKHATRRSLVILDELGRGTSTHDGVAIAYAVLRHFIEKIKCMTLFVTHYPSLAKLVHEFQGIVGNYHMGFLEAEGEDGSHTITFLYKLTEGVAMKSYGINVARLAKLPQLIIERASEKSHELDQKIRYRQQTSQIADILKLLFRNELTKESATEIVKKVRNYLKFRE